MKPQMNADEHGWLKKHLCSSVFICGSLPTLLRLFRLGLLRRLRLLRFRFALGLFSFGGLLAAAFAFFFALGLFGFGFIGCFLLFGLDLLEIRCGLPGGAADPFGLAAGLFDLRQRAPGKSIGTDRQLYTQIPIAEDFD